MKVFVFITGIFAMLAGAARMLAQDLNLAADDLKYTKGVIAHSHLIAQVEFKAPWNPPYRYRYDRYPDVEEITWGGTEYARRTGMSWRASDDSGAVIDEETRNRLDRDAAIANLPFLKLGAPDQEQGDAVWRIVDDRISKDGELLTFEMSRQHPHPNGFYPRFTFIKHKDDKDGSLLLDH